MLRLLLSKPKVIFGDSYTQGVSGQEQMLFWYIPVINLRRYGWLGNFFKRNEAIECRVKIEFTMDGKLLYRWVEPWEDSPIGKTLPADSSHNDFPIVSLDWNDNISLPNSHLSTNSNTPPYKIPKQAHIIANIQVTSRKKCIASSQWSIDIDTPSLSPVILRRI